MKEKAYLLGDIGGTNARFSVVSVEKSQNQKTTIYAVRENPTLIGALNKFYCEIKDDYQIISAAIAVAGPALSDTIKITNSDWVCDKQEIQVLLGIQDVFLFNDFEAVALAVTKLSPSEISVVQAGNPNPSRPILVMGPGTGLGVAAVVKNADGTLRAFSTEGGHVRYAPANDREQKLIKYLLREHNFITAEHLVSGPGLINLYRANCHLVDKECEITNPADVVDRARRGDHLCRLVLDEFSAIFGSFASQLALSWIPLGGIFLTGGVIQKLGTDFNSARFIERLGTNPKMSGLLEQMPVFRVHADIPAFVGLLAFLEQHNTN